MASTIPQSTLAQIGNSVPGIGAALVATQAAAIVDINALISTGGAVPAPTAATKMLYDNGAAYVETNVGTAGQVLVVNAGATAPVHVSISGDATLAASGAMVNTKINGAAVAAAGALTTGNVPTVTGVSTLTYQAINLAGGANYVTGVLPSANVSTLFTVGTPLTDTATTTVQRAASRTSFLLAGTMTQGETITLGTTGAVAGDQIKIIRTSVSAQTAAIVNGGGGAGTLFTMPASKINFMVAQYDGTNWLFDMGGVQ